MDGATPICYLSTPMKNQNRYTLLCFAPDGASVREGQWDTIQAVWERASDMGSRWFFYPICVVAGAAGHKPFSGDARRARIVDVPHGMPREWVGKTVGKLSDTLKANAQHAADYCNGRCPLEILPS
jgi:hypothetical protein